MELAGVLLVVSIKVVYARSGAGSYRVVRRE